jgi:hypothetical protein
MYVMADLSSTDGVASDLEHYVLCSIKVDMQFR